MSNVETTVYIFNKGGNIEKQRIPIDQTQQVICTMLSKHTLDLISPKDVLLEGQNIESIVKQFAIEADNNTEYSLAVEFKDVNVSLDNSRSTLCIESHLV